MNVYSAIIQIFLSLLNCLSLHFFSIFPPHLHKTIACMVNSSSSSSASPIPPPTHTHTHITQLPSSQDVADPMINHACSSVLQWKQCGLLHVHHKWIRCRHMALRSTWRSLSTPISSARSSHVNSLWRPCSYTSEFMHTVEVWFPRT